MHRLLVDPVDGGGFWDTRDRQYGRADVDDVGELGAQLSRTLDAIGPLHDHRIAGSAEM